MGDEIPTDHQTREDNKRLSQREPLTRAESEFASELFERHRLSLYHYLRGLLTSREDASEILQETYLRLLRQPSFDHVRQNARAYLFQTATNLARDFYRQRSARGAQNELEAFTASALSSPDWTSWPELKLEGEQIYDVVVAALAELKTSVRSALLLYRFRDLTHNQIAVWMGVSERTVERYIKEGLAHISSRLKEKL